MTNWKEVQRTLAALGHYTGAIDGIRGPRTDAAIIEFKKSVGLKPRAYFGPITKAALLNGVNPQAPTIATPMGDVEVPPWLRLAYGHLGLREIPGKSHNKTILSWWELLGLHFRDDETPWCAGFANAMIKESGLQIVPKYRAAALGWRWTGYGTRLNKVALGSALSITRPGRAGSGHLTFVAGRNKKGQLMCIGGNQGNAVSMNPYHLTDRDAQYHWPEGYPLPKVTGIEHLPVINAQGVVLENES